MDVRPARLHMPQGRIDENVSKPPTKLVLPLYSLHMFSLWLIFLIYALSCLHMNKKQAASKDALLSLVHISDL